MDKQSLEQRANISEIMERRRTTVMWSQSNLQPLQQNVAPGFQ